MEADAAPVPVDRQVAWRQGDPEPGWQDPPLTSAALRWSSPVPSTSASTPRQRRLRASPCSMLSHTTRKALAGTAGAASSPSATGTCSKALLSSPPPCGPPGLVGTEAPGAVGHLFFFVFFTLKENHEQYVLREESSRKTETKRGESPALGPTMGPTFLAGVRGTQASEGPRGSAGT